MTLTKWRRIWDERFPRIALEVGEVSEADQRSALTDGRHDMCFARLPIDDDGIHTIRLYEEEPVVWMHKDFVLAALDEVTAADLADFRIVDDYSADAVDLAVYAAAALRVPLSVARTQSRRDMVHRPVVDAEPTTIVLAWLIANDNPLVEEFIGIVRGRTANSSRTTTERATRKGGSTQSSSPTPRAGEPRRAAAGRRSRRPRGR